MHPVLNIESILLIFFCLFEFELGSLPHYLLLLIVFSPFLVSRLSKSRLTLKLSLLMWIFQRLCGAFCMANRAPIDHVHDRR